MVEILAVDQLPKRTVRTHPSDKTWMTPRRKLEINAREKAYTYVRGIMWKSRLAYFMDERKLLPTKSRRYARNEHGKVVQLLPPTIADLKRQQTLQQI